MDVELLQILFVTANTPNPSGVYTACKLLLKLWKRHMYNAVMNNLALSLIRVSKI